MESVDWNAKAAAMADFVSAHFFEARQGAIAWRDYGCAVVFGDDGYHTEFTQREVAELRKELDRLGITVLGFGVDTEDGYSWAMLVDYAVKFGKRGCEVFKPVPVLTELIHQVWMRLAVAASAEPSVSQHGIRPDHSAN
jgi:hypothetical protein